MGTTEPLTERQGEILKLIRELTESSGFPPTRAEIAEKMGFRSVNAAEQHLRALEKKGVLEILQGASRGLRVKDKVAPRAGRVCREPAIATAPRCGSTTPMPATGESPGSIRSRERRIICAGNGRRQPARWEFNWTRRSRTTRPARRATTMARS